MAYSRYLFVGLIVAGMNLGASMDNNAIQIVPDPGQTSEIWAAIKTFSEPEGLQRLQDVLKSGVNPNICDDSGQTPLHLAVSISKGIEAVRLLLAHGAVAHAQTKSGKTPLHLASGCNNCDSVQLLLWNGGVARTLQDNDGRTPLHSVVSSHEPMLQVIQMLAGDETAINMLDHENKTPMHLVVEKFRNDDSDNSLKIVDFFMRHGADPTIPDAQGKTVLDLAVENAGEKWSKRIAERFPYRFFLKKNSLLLAGTGAVLAAAVIYGAMRLRKK